MEGREEEERTKGGERIDREGGKEGRRERESIIAWRSSSFGGVT